MANKIHPGFQEVADHTTATPDDGTTLDPRAPTQLGSGSVSQGSENGEQAMSFHAEVTKADEYNKQQDEASLEGAIESSELTADESKNSPSKESIYRRVVNFLTAATRVEWKTILWLVLPETPLLVVAFTALILMTAVMLAVPPYMGQVIDTFSGPDGEVKDDAETTLLITSCILLALFVVGSSTTAVRAAIFAAAGERMVARLRRRLFKSIIHQDIGFFDQTRTGDLINRLADDTQALRTALTTDIALAIRNGLQAAVGVVLLFVISWKLTMVMLLSVPPCALAVLLYGGAVKALSRRVQDSLARAATVAEEAVSNVRTVHAFGNEERHQREYSVKVGQSLRLGLLLAVFHGSFQGFALLIGGLDLIVMLWYGGTLVIQGEMTSGTLLSFLLYTLWVAFGLAQLSQLFSQLMRAAGASDRIFALIRRKPKIVSTGGIGEEERKKGPGDVQTKVDGLVEFEGVDFYYPSRPDTRVLKNFTMQFEPGSVTALVGPSGGGKSTIANCILRLYDPASGLVKIDGIDVRDYDARWMRQSNIAIVSQEPVLFSCSIAENIAYARPSASLEEIEAAATSANAMRFIESFPDGLRTVVGERGVRLSGGQKQRIAIARAVLVNPKILILDEATSALDAESEHLVQEALERLMKGRTVVVIAHRLSTIQRASKIAVITNGILRQCGTHEELLADTDGVYAALVSRQMQQKAGEDIENDDNGIAEEGIPVEAAEMQQAAPLVAHPISVVPETAQS